MKTFSRITACFANLWLWLGGTVQFHKTVKSKVLNCQGDQIKRNTTNNKINSNVTQQIELLNNFSPTLQFIGPTATGTTLIIRQGLPNTKQKTQTHTHIHTHKDTQTPGRLDQHHRQHWGEASKTTLMASFLVSFAQEAPAEAHQLDRPGRWIMHKS